jgi:molybdopterin synthase catalytic subunit
MIRITATAFDPGAELAAFTDHVDAAGAIASFTGLVRAASDGVDVTGLELEHYPGFTERAVQAIADQTVARFALVDLTIIHRHGAMAPGEAIVFVAGAAPHRRAAFDAVDHVMDRLKIEAPFWKREHGPAGSKWLEARACDLADHARWEREDENGQRG